MDLVRVLAEVRFGLVGSAGDRPVEPDLALPGPLVGHAQQVAPDAPALVGRSVIVTGVLVQDDKHAAAVAYLVDNGGVVIGLPFSSTSGNRPRKTASRNWMMSPGRI